MSLRAGALLGASAGALMGIVESIDVIGRYGELLFGPTAGILVVALILASTIAAGAALGLALAALARLVRAGEAGIVPRAAAFNRAILSDPSRDARITWRLAVPVALLLAAALYLLSRIFLAVPMGARELAPYVLAVVGLAALGLLARRTLGPRRGRSALVTLSAAAWSLVFLSAGTFALLYVIDRDYYAGFHPAAHAVLAAAAFGCALALLVALIAAIDPARMRFPRRIALGLLGLWLVAAGAAALFYDANQDVKAFLYNRTTYARRIYALLSPALDPSGPRAAPARAARVAHPTSAPATAPDLRGANLILITIDAARVDHLGTFGSPRRATPAIDRFARKCALFRRAYAQSADTFPSFASIMTGRYPSELEWQTPYAPPLPASNVTLAEILREAGYATAAVTSHAAFAGRGGLAQGFARHDHSAGPPNRDNRAVVSDQVERNAEAMLGSLSQPFFLWTHFHDPHAHYMPRPANRFGDRDVDRYDGELAGTDASIGKLLRWIKANVKRPTIVVIASDHGEEFGEHGRQYHGATLYEDAVHVPLLIRIPGWRGRSIAEPVQLLDLAPTVLDLLRVSPPVPLSGRSLGPLLAGRPEQAAPPVVVSEATGVAWKRMALADPWKLIHDYEHDTWELYNLWNDPGEERNRYHLEPEVVSRLQPILLAYPGLPR